MRRGTREPRRLAITALALLAGVACADAPRAPGPGAEPGGSSLPVPTVTATPTGTPGGTPAVTPPAGAGRSYVIGVIGDWGIDDEPVRRVVRAMTRFNDGARLDAVVTTGDNAYNRGTESESRFAWRLLAPLRTKGTPIYPAIGNHDAATEGGARFMRVFGMTQRWYTANVGPVQFVVLDSTRVSDSGQLRFLKTVLATPRPGSFRVVVFHHPGWSCSAHSPDEAVVDRWLPLFGTEVDLVMAGHNHTWERFRSPDGTPYVTTGGGGARLYSSARAACRGVGRIQFLRTVHHAARLVATRTSLRVEAVTPDGAVFDTITLEPR